MKISTRIENLISEAIKKEVREIKFFPGSGEYDDVRILFNHGFHGHHSEIDANTYQQILRYAQLKAHTEYKSPFAQDGTYKLMLNDAELTVKVTTIPVVDHRVALVLTF